jgi:hypothetical protein
MKRILQQELQNIAAKSVPTYLRDDAEWVNIKFG